MRFTVNNEDTEGSGLSLKKCWTPGLYWNSGEYEATRALVVPNWCSVGKVGGTQRMLFYLDSGYMAPVPDCARFRKRNWWSRVPDGVEITLSNGDKI